MKKSHFVVAAGFLVYCVLGLSWIALPGPQQDELLFLNAAFPQSYGTVFLAKLQIFRYDIPSMLLTYVGALKGWLWAGIFLVFEPTIYSVRVPAVLLGGLALFLFYKWARIYYPANTATLAVALACLDPTYIYTARLDWGPVVLSHVLKFAGLLLGSTWYEAVAGRSSHSRARGLLLLGGAGFCFGLGVWDKAIFIWFLVALGLSIVLFFPRQVRTSISPASGAVFVSCLLVGALPLLVFNYKNRSEGTASMARFETLTDWKIANKVDNLKSSLRGGSTLWLTGINSIETAGEAPPPAGRILDFASSFSEMFGNPFAEVVFVACAVAPFLAGGRRAVCFPFAVAGLMWVQMMLARDGGVSVHHCVLLYPFPHLGLAAVVSYAWARADGLSKRLVVAVLAVVFVCQLSVSARHLRMFRHSGGALYWTDAIYDVAEVVQQRSPSKLVLLDWGFSNPMLLLTKGRIPTLAHAIGAEPFAPADVGYFAGLIREPNTLFLLRAPGLESGGTAWKMLESAAASVPATRKVVKRFYQRDGAPVAVLVRFSPQL